MDKGFWMRSGGGYPESEISYDNPSKLEPKRPNQWFPDPSDTGLFSHKKSAVEGLNGRPNPGVPTVNPSWEVPSSFQSVQSVAGNFSDRLFGPDPPRTIDFGGRNFQPISSGSLDNGRRVLEGHFANDASVALSMSHSMEDPGSSLTYGGIRKVKVNQVKDSDNVSMQMGNTYGRSDCNSINFHSFQEAPEANTEHHRPLQMKGSGNGMPIQMSNNFNRFDNNTISFCGYQDEREGDVRHGRMLNPVKEDENIMSMQLGSTFSKGDSNTLSFSGFSVEPETNNYDLLVRQSSQQQSEVVKEKRVDVASTDVVVSAIPMSAVSSKAAKAKNEQKEAKKAPPNSFPSNVRSLLNTGMLDGVPVKYISWQHEELGGIIKGCGYRCGCNACSYSKVLNAYEFEKHAGTKTKHPNNHIYFENGKTIYAIVQELKTTSPNLLFEAIQNCTGSPINLKAFSTWKESYQAATRELERIYGKDSLKQ